MAHDLGDSEDEQTFKSTCINASHCTEMLHRRLQPVLASSAAALKAYAFKERVKPWWSVRDKVLSKRNGGNSLYGVNLVKDISGFRIVTLFNADIPHRLELLLSLLDGGGDLFCDRLSTVHEIEIHSNRRPDDPQAITGRVNAIVERWRERGPLPSPKSAGSFSAYSSVHLVLEFPKTEQIPQPTRSEIQIRSVFEEAWGEISHKLGYGPDKLAASKEHEAGVKVAPQLWKQHLDALKSLADSCAHYSDLIAQEAGWSPGEVAKPPPGPKSLPGEGKSLAFYDGLPHALLEQIDAAFLLRDRAEELRDAEGRSLPQAAQAFREAAARLEGLINSLQGKELLGDPRRDAEVLNGLRAECAYCLMHAQEPDLITKAERLWREVIHVNADFVPAHHRLGSLLMRRSEHEEAGQLLEIGERLAVEQLKATPDPPLRRRLLLIRRDLGINYWRLSERADGAKAKTDMLNKAIGATFLALQETQDDRDVRTLAANALYCLAEVRSIGLAWSADRDDEAKVILERLRSVKDFGNWTRDKGWSDFVLDSVMRGETAFGRAETARVVATELLKRLNEKLDQLISGGLNPGLALGALDADDQDIYRVATQTVVDWGV
jgi:ppGpp synthetase/RelA/SpoT-type nucleotidyltranferase